VLSFQAAYASPIILMSQNRQDRLSQRRNHLDLQVNLLAEQETTAMLRLLHKLCEKLNVDLTGEAALAALELRTKPDKLVRQIDTTVHSHVGPASPGHGPTGRA